MNKKFISLCVVGVMVLFLAPAKSEAGFFEDLKGPLPVKDDSSIAQQSLTVSHALTQIENQILMLKNQALHLLKLDRTSAERSRDEIGKNLGDLAKISHPDVGVALEYAKLQEEWNLVYDISKISGLDNPTSIHDYAMKVKQLMQYTKVATGNARAAQGFVSQIDVRRPGAEESEREMLNRLILQSTDSPGTLAAAQTGNQIAALQTAQMMRLQYLIAGSQNSQAAYQAEVALREAMAAEAVQRFYTRQISKDTKNEMAGELAGLDDWKKYW